MSSRLRLAPRAAAAVAAIALAVPAAVLTTLLPPAPAAAASTGGALSVRSAPVPDRPVLGRATAREAPVGRGAVGPAREVPVGRGALVGPAREVPVGRGALVGPARAREAPVGGSAVGPASARRGPEPGAEPFLWPVDAPLLDRFRPPATPYSRGNRGIDFGTAAGELVVAAAAGEVVFAGAVGHTLHVVVLHAGGVRTSYSFLQRVDVRRGQQVERGDVVGRAGATLHFGVRVGASYVDPLAFLGLRLPLRPYLVQDRDERPAAPRWK